MTSPKLTGTPLIAGLVLVLAALSGGIAGVAVDRLLLLPHMFHGWQGDRHDGRGPPPDDFRRRMGRELGLAPDQQTRVDSIMERQMRGVREVRATVQPQLDSIVARTRRELDSVLTPDQRKKAEEFRKRHPPPPGMRGELPGGRLEGGGPPPPRP